MPTSLWGRDAAQQRNRSCSSRSNILREENNELTSWSSKGQNKPTLLNKLVPKLQHMFMCIAALCSWRKDVLKCALCTVTLFTFMHELLERKLGKHFCKMSPLLFYLLIHVIYLPVLWWMQQHWPKMEHSVKLLKVAKPALNHVEARND